MRRVPYRTRAELVNGVRILARRADARFFEPAPATRLAALRMLVFGFATIFLAGRAPYLFDISQLPAHRFEPIGILWWLDRPAPLAVVYLAVGAAVIAGVAATAGWRYRFTGAVFALLYLLISTYDNCWQHVAHTQNLVAMHLLVLAVAPAADAWSVDERHGREPAAIAIGPPASDARYGWTVRLMSLITVLTYVVAGVAKQRNGGLDWITGDVLRNQIAHDNLRKYVVGDFYSPLGGRLVRHGWLFPPMALMTMVIELGAPIALLRGRVRTAFVSGMWLFHVSILAVMAITFLYPLTGIAYASLLAPERLFDRVLQHRWRRAVAAT